MQKIVGMLRKRIMFMSLVVVILVFILVGSHRFGLISLEIIVIKKLGGEMGPEYNSKDVYSKIKDQLCGGLLSNGSFNSTSKSWQPHECQMMHYTREKAVSCLKIAPMLEGRNYFSFIGDSRIKVMAERFGLLVSDTVALGGHDDGRHLDIKIPVSCLKIASMLEGRNYFSFIGDSRIREVAGRLGLLVSDAVALGSHNDGRHLDIKIHMIIDSLWRQGIDDELLQSIRDYSKMPVRAQPKLMVIGQAVHTILDHCQNPEIVRDYKRNMTRVRKELNKLKNTTILWVVNQRVEPKLMSYPLRFIKNELINELNTAAIQVLIGSKVHIWYSSRLLSLEYPYEYRDGIHRGFFHVDYDVQMLLNYLCNPYTVILRPNMCCKRHVPPFGLSLKRRSRKRNKSKKLKLKQVK